MNISFVDRPKVDSEDAVIMDVAQKSSEQSFANNEVENNAEKIMLLLKQRISQRQRVIWIKYKHQLIQRRQMLWIITQRR